jgi:hypothetical protein
MISTANLQAAIAQLQREGKLPAELTPDQVAKLRLALAKSTGEVNQAILDKIMDHAKSQIQDLAAAVEPEVRRTIFADLNNLLNDDGVTSLVYRTLDRTQTLFNGAGTFMSQNLSQEAVDDYPGLALERMFDRDVPRGFKTGKGGKLVPVPDDDWPSRWAEAGEACGDDDWCDWEGDSQTGRGVALKSSAIWETLGNLRDDSIGNPFAPFAWESGFRTTSVSRDTCVELGLIGAQEQAKPAKFKLTDLFPSPV